MPKEFLFDVSEIQGAKVGRSKRNLNAEKVASCETCRLSAGCSSPFMPAYGQGLRRLFIVGEAPGRKEDLEGRSFVGESGTLLCEALAELGLVMDRDCTRSNVVQCRPPDNRDPTDFEIRCCYSRLEQQITEAAPNVILCLGGPAINRVLEDSPMSRALTPTMMCGQIVPSIRYQAWVACAFHPAYYSRRPYEEAVLYRDLARAVKYLDIPFTDRRLDHRTGYQLVVDHNEACELLRRASMAREPVGFDIETTGLDPYAKGAEIIMATLALTENDSYAILLNKAPDKVHKAFAAFLYSGAPKVIQRAQFERAWCAGRYDVRIQNVVHDTKLGAHLLDERKGVNGLGFQVWKDCGDTYKDMVDVTATASAPVETLSQYGCLDSRYTLRLGKQQMAKFAVAPALQRALQFFMTADEVLSMISHRGVRLDRKALDEAQASIKPTLIRLSSELRELPAVVDYTRHSGKPFNPNSSVDVMGVLKDELGIRLHNTRKETLLWAQRQLPEAQHPIVTKILQVRKLSKLDSTYLEGFRRAADADDIIRPTFTLHGARTYRSTSERPNFQNLPLHDPELRKFRRVIHPRIGDTFLEIDVKGAEVLYVGIYTKDPVLLGYLKEGVDFHRRWGATLYDTPEASLSKTLRSHTKNGFVFPEFYGSYYVTIARELSLPEAHVKEVETQFWQEFAGVREWQREWEDFYNRYGYVETFYGFRGRAPLSRNQIINIPIQATAFHRLLDGLVLAECLMREAGLKSVIVLEVHDSIVIDLVSSELEQVLEILRAALSVPLYEWEVLPMQFEAMVGPNWYDMQPITA